MKKQIIAGITTHPVRAAFLLILLFLLGSVMHQALGQGNSGRRSVAANLSQAGPPSTDGAVIGTYAPTPNIPAMDQSQLVAPAVPSSAWTVATPYPIPVVRYGFAQTATHFYVFGGVSNGTRVPDVNRMVLATGMWESRAPMPFTSEAPTCALMASTGIVYCTEGDTGSGFASYNIATNTWTPLANIPGGDHYGSASGAFNGKVFVAGGTTAFTSAVQVYDVASNTWSPGTAAPNDFLLAGYQQVGQFLYVAGGFEVGGPNQAAAEQSSVLRKGLQPAVPSANNATTLRLDMSSAPGVWSTGPAFTPGRADFGLAYDAGTNKLYALGGDATGNGFFDSTNLVDELSVASWPAGSWTASPDNLILPNRQGNQSGFYGAGQIWSVGGIVGQTFQFLAEVQRRTNGGGGCDNYTTTTSTGTITPGSTDSGNHCDDCATAITFPFPVSVYGQTFNSANVASNGALDLIGTQAPFTHGCQVLPSTLWTMAIFPYQDDLRTDNLGFTGCNAFPGATCGVFTSVTGTAPNRQFNVEWRAVHFADTTTSANFEVVFSENQSSFDVIYGATSDNGLDETSGVQASATGPATTFSCGTATLANGLKVTYTCAGGGGCTQAWQNEPPMTNARRNPATVAVGTDLYAITGFNAAPDYTAVNERFNGTSWATLAPIPVPHAQSKGAAVGTNIYVPGGFNSVSFGGPLDTMQIYNTTTNTWSSGMTMPGTRGGPATAAFNGLVYLIAGYTTPFPTVTNTVFIYNPGTNSYTMGAPMPAGQGNVAGVLFNGEIYVVGGGTAPGAQYAYNPATNMWRTIAVLPTTGGTCQSDNGFVLDNELWIVGCLGLPINQQVWIYNPGSNSWRAGPPYNVDHQGPGAALFNARGFAVGGGTAGGGSTAVESVNGCAAPCQFRVLIAYSDIGGPPTTLQSQIMAEPGVTAVDLFDANSGTPTLAQLTPYNIVVAFPNNAYNDAVGMGNVLADYADTGGVVVALNFTWFGAPFGLDGRWMTGGYTPFNSPGPTNFTTSCLGTYDTTHPLMQGISAGSLCAFFRHTLTLSSGAVSVAMYQDSQQLCAYKTNSGHTGVGINAYLGANPENFSGPFGRVIVNAGRWLSGSCAPVPSSAVSRKVHGAFTGDINLPLVAIGGAVGIECRNGAGGYQMVVTFPNPVTVGGVSVTSGTGNVGSSSVSGGVVTINLTGVTDAQRLGVTLANVNDGTSTGDVLVPMGVLIGDSAGTGNGSVNAGDVGFVKSVSGQTAGAGNFRADVAINGTINASDVGLVKANSGHSLPP